MYSFSWEKNIKINKKFLSVYEYREHTETFLNIFIFFVLRLYWYHFQPMKNSHLYTR